MKQLYDALPTTLGYHLDGAVFHIYSDVTVIVQSTYNGLYNVIAFNRYGNVIDELPDASYTNVMRMIIGTWGYPLIGWRALFGFSIYISERPADCSPPNGVLWKAMHPKPDVQGA